MPDAPAQNFAAPETVVLLHGVAVPRVVMIPLARNLRRHGYEVINLGYPSRTLDIEQIATEYLPAQLAALGLERRRRVHFVTHSMGSLVLRRYLRDSQPANLGRVVMLGPPNAGSAAADRATVNRFMRFVMGVNVERLGTGPRAITRELGPANFDLGIIAGGTTINPLFLHVMKGQHDGVVTVDSARLEGMRDFLVMPHSHTIMLWRRPVHRQVLHYLREGRFRR